MVDFVCWQSGIEQTEQKYELMQHDFVVWSNLPEKSTHFIIIRKKIKWSFVILSQRLQSNHLVAQ